MERSYREFGVKFFYLWGDTVTLNVKSFGAFCDELIARKLPMQWFGNARADNLGDPAFVQRLREAGCWMLALGIETESEETRKDMMKRLEGKKIRTALTNMRAAGIRSFGFFILGYPGETPQTLDRTIAYAIDLDPDFANFYPAVPYPGTELYAKAKRDGLLVSEDWTRWSTRTTCFGATGSIEAVVMDAINRAKRRFYLRPALSGAPCRRCPAVDVHQMERCLARRVALPFWRAGHRCGRSGRSGRSARCLNQPIDVAGAERLVVAGRPGRTRPAQRVEVPQLQQVARPPPDSSSCSRPVRGRRTGTGSRPAASAIRAR